MASVLNTNMSSINSQRHLSKSQNALNNSLAKLASGLRINSAKDDAAGMAISQRMTAQINGLSVAHRNANDGISFSQTAEGALGEMGSILQRIRELAVQSANATNSAADRKSLNDEVNQLISELDRFAITTEFNGKKILNDDNSVLNFHIGANANQTITTTTMNFRTNKYGSYQLGGDQICTDEQGGGQYEVISNAVDGTDIIKGKQLSKSAILSDGVLTLNGSYGSASISLSEEDSASDIANKINKYQEIGLKASARTETSFFVMDSGSYTFSIWTSNSTSTPDNTEVAHISFTVEDRMGKDNLQIMVNAFNEQSAKTGIVAKLGISPYGIVLINNEGKNINLLKENKNDASADIAIGNDSKGFGTVIKNIGTLTAAGQVLIDSERSYSITTEKGLQIQEGVLSGVAIGATDRAMTYGSDLKRVNSIDITTVKGANQAIHIVDMALDAVNSQRAKFGALQNRFEHTISNLQTSEENVSAARSRIQDADYANETATMSRNQVLQQASTSMLVQANQLPNNILTLLG